MIEVYGKKIPTTIEELVDPVHTAVIVVDAQNDFCKEGGCVAKSGQDLSGYPKTIKNIRKLIEAAREVGVLVVYIMTTTLPNHASESVASIIFLIKTYGYTDPEKIPIYTLEGTWGEQIVDELKPKEGDVIVRKNRASGFVQSNLDLILRNHNINTLVITGFITNGCVLATVRDGDCFDYLIVAAKGCMNSTRKDLHEYAVKLMEARFDTFTSDQLINVWKSKK